MTFSPTKVEVVTHGKVNEGREKEREKVADMKEDWMGREEDRVIKEGKEG